MADLYSSYKPLRNYLRGFNLWSGLTIAYRFLHFLDFGKELPENFRNPALVTRTDWLRRGIVQWEFETLIKEMILNCSENGGAMFTHWNQIAKAINHIKRIENDAYGIHERQDQDILYELVRIAHRQFPWQNGLNREFVARYHWLYRQDGLSQAILQIFGMSVTELFQISLGLGGLFAKKPSVVMPIVNDINSVDSSRIGEFIEIMSIDIGEARSMIIERSEYNVNWAYSFNPIRSFPLLKFGKNSLFCPITDFLIRRVTSGIYFDLMKIPDVGGRYLGPAVQNLIGEVARSSSKGGFDILHECEYGGRKNRKDSIDWIISDLTAHLFVEAKAARVRFRGTSDLINRDEIRREFDRVRQFALQAYITIADALAGAYRHWTPDQRPCYLTVVTLEDWQAVGFHIEREVLLPLTEELAALGIDPELPRRVPMSFCHVSDFEAALHVGAKVGLGELFRRKSEGEHHLWQLGVFLLDQFKEELNDFEPSAFEDEWLLLVGG